MRQQRGFTLVELVMVIIITAILAVYAVSRFGSVGQATGSTEAAHFARDLRHAQMLAITWGQQLIVTRAASSYSVSCATAGSAPCNDSPVHDPFTGQAFSVALQNGATFTAGPATLRFDSLGRPSTGAAPATSDSAYTLSSGGLSWTITVRKLTGLVEVSP